MRKILTISTLILYTLVYGGSPNNEYSKFLPDLGDTDRARLSPTDADFLGRQIVQDINNQGGMLFDYDTLNYLNDVGNELVSYSPLAGGNFNFYLIKDKEINAFALPGGYICFYNGLLATADSEAELASVMAHEIGHIVQHHIFRNIGNYNRSQWVAIAGMLAGGLLAVVNPSAALLAISGGQGIAIQNMLSFSRDFEREADRVGQKIMYNAGYNPHAMPLFFQRMQDQNKFNNNEALAFLQTHPVTSERLSEAMERANQLMDIHKPDSLSFMLIREKARTRQLGAPSAILFYTTVLNNLNAGKTNSIKIINNINKNNYSPINTGNASNVGNTSSNINNNSNISNIVNIDNSNININSNTITTNTNIKTKVGNYNIIYYGLAFAQMGALKYNDALTTINKITDANIKRHPAYFSLKAQILTALNKYSESNKVYNQGLDIYPNYKGLWLGQIDLNLKAKDIKKVAVQLENLSLLYPNDGDIWAREALVYSDVNLNNKPKYHYAFGNQLFLLLNYRGALEQYQLALKYANNNDVNNSGINNQSKNLDSSIFNDMISSKIIETQRLIRNQAQYSG